MTDKKKAAGMKSALELAMERLEKSDGAARSLTAEQKQAIAEIEKQTKAKLAEIEILSAKDLAEARAQGDGAKIQSIEEERKRAIDRAKSRGEEEKDKVRGQG